MPTWIRRVMALLRRGRLTHERTEELQFHFDQEVAAGLRRGLSPEEARRQARLRVGLVSEAIETTREALGFRWLDGAATDLRHALRAVRRSRGFGTVAVLVLGASVAINTLVFFMLDGVVLRPLPYRTPDRLVRLYDGSPFAPKFPMAIGRYLDYREHAQTLDGLALYTRQDVELTGSATRSRQLTGVAITTDYFSLLGRPPALGRAFTDDDLRGGVRHAILGARLWREQFRADPAIVGQAIRLNREAWTIIGVAPDDFEHVGGDFRSPPQGDTVDIWLPLATDRSNGELRGSHFCNAVARLRDGVTDAQARADLTRLAAAYTQRYKKFGEWTARMEPLQSEVTGGSRQVIWLLVGAGALVVLVACANLAGLCVARLVSRRKELGLRRALGATRWHLLRVGLAENLIVGAAGAALGLLLAGAGLPVLRHLLPADFPRAHAIALTGRGALFAAAVALVTVLVAGLIASGGRGTLGSTTRVTEGRESRRLRRGLVVGEIALAGLLCAAALFLLRSYQELGARDHGFNASGALTFQIMLPGTGVQPGVFARTYEEIRTAIAAIPSVTAVGASTNLPWSGYDENTGFTIVGRATDDEDGPGGRYQAASPGYFEAVGMRLERGRFFDATRDRIGQPLTLIVNDALARRYFPRGDAVGATVRVFGANREIVGVVKGLTDTPADPDVKSAFWFPLGQVEFESVFFAVRTAGVEPAALTADVTRAVHAVDAELPLADVRTLERRADGALASRRFALWLLQAFAALVLVLASAGIYGLLAYVVRQRRKELGIRLALGASHRNLWGMVLSDGLGMAAAGALACLLLIPLAGLLLRTFLFNVAAYDPFTIVAAPAALLAMAFVASLGPARAATQSDPARVLRDD